MNAAAQQLYETALRLPDEERAELAALLIDSLDARAEEALDAAWGVEIRRRLDELDSGVVTTLPWPDARRMILDLADESPAD